MKFLFLLLVSLPSQAHSLCDWFQLAAFEKWNDADLITQSQKNVAFISTLKTQYTELRVNNRVVVYGLPQERGLAHILQPSEIQGIKFRHYSTPERIKKIVQQNRIIAGPTPFVSSPWVYTDLTGVFFTKPAFSQEKVGLSSAEHTAYVDLELDPKLGLLQLDEGIYLVPGAVALPDWMIQTFKKQSKDLLISPSQLKRHETFGVTPMVVPVKILASKL